MNSVARPLSVAIEHFHFLPKSWNYQIPSLELTITMMQICTPKVTHCTCGWWKYKIPGATIPCQNAPVAIFNELQKFICCELSSWIILTCFQNEYFKGNWSRRVFTLLCYVQVTLICILKFPLVHLELPLVYAKSLWTRRNFEILIAPGSRWLISRLPKVFNSWPQLIGCESFCTLHMNFQKVLWRPLFFYSRHWLIQCFSLSSFVYLPCFCFSASFLSSCFVKHTEGSVNMHF